LGSLFNYFTHTSYYVDQSLLEINFRNNGIIYKIFCKEHIFQKKGIPDLKKLRLISFFPVSEKQMLDRLGNEFVERQIEANLSIFVKY
jgi:hypothetical protein